jgi:putative restriction endonuclease
MAQRSAKSPVRGFRQRHCLHLDSGTKGDNFKKRIRTNVSGVAPDQQVTAWDATLLKARVAFGLPDSTDLEPPHNEIERRYALRTVKQRLHQASFREAVMNAYGGRRALSGLPESRLLDAAHIVADSHEMLGHAVVPNGIPMSKMHHAAFDAHLIGIDPDYHLYVSPQLLDQDDGPMLEALKKLHGGTIHLPTRKKDYPDRDRLSMRFEQFKAAC